MSRSPATSTVDILSKLISFDTVSRNSNLDLIDWIGNYLASHGIVGRLIHDETGKKSNLYATIGDSARPGFMLSGHTDVVPVDGQNWSTDPFVLTQKGDRFYGRGTSDMKSFLAVMLGMVPEFKAAALNTPINLAFTYDEEVGCKGAPGLIEHIRSLETTPRLCIVGEPTSMKVVTGHKGNKRYRCEVCGLESHSALADRGVNAVEMAASLVHKLRLMADRRVAQGPHDQGFDPPYTTIHTGLIHGGTAVNIVPKDCHFEFEYRYIPDEDPAEIFREITDYADTLLAGMRATHPGSRIDFIFKSELPELDTAEEADVTVLARSLSGSNETSKISFGTEGGLFQQAGLPTVICGPGSIEQAHKPDEWIALEQIALCEDFMRRLKERAVAA